MAVYTTIDDPGLFVNPLLYTGTGAIQSITGVGFAPAMAWFKSRTSVASHQLYDTVRGNASALVPSTAAAAIDATGDGFTSLDSDGYTFNAGGGGGNVNASQDFIAWNWGAGTTSGITTDGSTTITPSAYSFNTTSGFAVLKYTGNITSGAKLAHGLGAVPTMIICKNIDNADSWAVGHRSMDVTIPWDYALNLDTNAARDNSDSYWNDTAPDSVNITLGNGDNTNRAALIVAYCFTEKQGYSSFGRYLGTGDADISPFVYTGFRPAYVLYKKSSATEQWFLNDNKRLGYNPDNEYLFSDTDAIEGTANRIDFVSNGFRITTADGGANTSGATYIYMAFAEAPLVNSEGVPGNAR